METNTYKKIQKITHAVYLATHHLKDNEPLKWELRKEALSFLACSQSLNEEDEIRDISIEMATEAFLISARDLIALLSLSLVSRLISFNNANLVIKEVESVVDIFRKSGQEAILKDGYILSEDFFAGDPVLQNGLKGHLSHKGQNTRQVPRLSSSHEKKMHTSDTHVAGEPIKDKKDKRQNQILELLKHQPNLTIKDFVRVIPGCSEKTIQRELAELMKKGVIKREGERRWSRYSIK